MNTKKTKNDYNYLKTVSLIIGSVTLFGLIVSIISFYIKINKIASKKAEEIIEAKFEDEREKLLQIIANQTEETQLKTKKKITVISCISSDTVFIKKFFKEMGFKNVDFKKTNKFEIINTYDLLFFNNEDSKIDKELIKEYINASKNNSLFFYFGSIRIKDFGANIPVVATNYRTQLYGNLISMLKYQKVLNN